MDVFHEPIEDGDVTVDRDVDIVERLLVTQVLLKVLHRGQKERFVTSEVLGPLFCLVANMDQHLILRRGGWNYCRSCIANKLGNCLA